LNIISRLLNKRVYYRDIKAGDKVILLSKRNEKELTVGKEYEVIYINVCNKDYVSCPLPCETKLRAIHVRNDRGQDSATCRCTFKNKHGIEYK
jgi:hypothetical protein